MREHDTAIKNLQRHVKIKHTDDPLDERKTIGTILETKIEIKGNMDLGDYPLPPIKGNKSVPEGWKIREDANIKHLTDRSKPVAEAKIETIKEYLDPGKAVKNNGSVPEGWKIRPDKKNHKDSLLVIANPL